MGENHASDAGFVGRRRPFWRTKVPPYRAGSVGGRDFSPPHLSDGAPTRGPLQDAVEADGIYSVLTDHARMRQQQRGISPGAVELLLDCGTEMHDHRGATIVFMDKKARRRLVKRAGRNVAHVAKQLRGMYAVIGSDGAVVTIGHRYRRINRP